MWLILSSLHSKSRLIWKDPDAGKDWGQEEKGKTEDEMVGHHWLDGRGFGWTPGVGDGQRGLVCCGSWGCKESDTTKRLNWTELTWKCIDAGNLFSSTHWWLNSESFIIVVFFSLVSVPGFVTELRGCGINCFNLFLFSEMVTTAYYSITY